MSLRLSEEYIWESIPCEESLASVAVCQHEWTNDRSNVDEENGRHLHKGCELSTLT